VTDLMVGPRALRNIARILVLMLLAGAIQIGSAAQTLALVDETGPAVVPGSDVSQLIFDPGTWAPGNQHRVWRNEDGTPSFRLARDGKSPRA
jgi:hypothetical protein